MLSRQVFSRGPSPSLPSQPSCAALLRDTRQQSLRFRQQLLFQISRSRKHEGWRDEDAGSCLCCVSFRTEPGHTCQHLWSTAAGCTMEIRVWESQRNEICLARTLLAPFSSSFGESGVTMPLHPWAPTETCPVSAKKYFPPCIKRKAGTK